MSKKAKVEETGGDAPPAEINWRKKPRSRRAFRKAGGVPFKHLDNPPHRVRTLMVYLLIAVVAFWFLHFVMKIG